MPDAARTAEAKGSSADSLRARIEDAAIQLVLGNADTTERITVLESICSEAKAAGRADVAAIAAEVLCALAHAAGETACDSISSEAITRMQRILVGGSTVADYRQATGAFEDRIESAPAAPPIAALEDRELVGDFILESSDHLTRVEAQMIALEKNPADAEAINTVFRAFHTIKGLAGFLDLTEIGEVAHETETLLDLARNRKLAIGPAVVDVVLAAADFLKIWLNRLEQMLADCSPGPAPQKLSLLERIHRIASGRMQAAAPLAESTGSANLQTTAGDQRPIGAADSGGPERQEGIERRADWAEARYVKIDTAKLDFLVDMAGEMVIAQAMVRHHPELAALRSPALLHSLAQLARITGDLQKTAMAMRMVPIDGLFQKMNRLVRDLARKTGKQAEMEAIGVDTELDRNVVEELCDPLMHMVRNAVDHGLETADKRCAVGKNPSGRIRLRAFHQAGHIVIEIADDGQGLNRDKILEKAWRTGLVEEGASLSDSEVFNLIFHPGFSTASKVTDVSGRGVGMDVVRKQIQKLRGHVEIHSVPGKGTSFFLRLPLTLAMIEGLVVAVGLERYIVPIFSVREMLRPSADMVFTVEGRHEMALVRNNLLPVVRLHKRFAVEARSKSPTESLLIVAEAAGKTFCILVDQLLGKQEVVIKSLGEAFKEIPGIAGGAILGDGRVGLILDLEGIFRGGSGRALQ